jgi:hypothetical protein
MTGASVAARQPWREDGAPLALVLLASVAAWLLLFAAVPPAKQDFPLDDDWAFARGAIDFANGRGVNYYGWAAMPQFGQWLWSWPFVRLFGPSFAVLRASTVLLSLLGVAAFYDLLRREIGAGPWPAAFAAAALAFNPVWFALCGTYMTDVPALSLSLLALAGYGRAQRGGRFGWLLAATAVALLAALTRQNTAAAPLAASVLCWRRFVGPRRLLWVGIIALPVVAAALAHVWLNRRSDVIAAQPFRPSPDRLVYVLIFAGQLLGLSAVPLLLLRGAVVNRKVFAVAVAVLLAGALWLYRVGSALSGGLFPYGGNILTCSGLGVSGEWVWGQAPVLLGTAAQVALTALGCLAGAVLLQLLAVRIRAGPGADLLLLYGLFSAPLLLISPVVFDRYLLVLLPPALGWAVAAGAGRVRPVAGLAGLAVCAVLSVLLMHDWLSWNAARWELGRRAIARGVAPAAVEGGFEWDGWYSAAGASRGQADPCPPLVLPSNHRLFPEVTGRLALGFTAPPGSTVIDSEPYFLVLPPGERRFLLVGSGPEVEK